MGRDGRARGDLGERGWKIAIHPGGSNPPPTLPAGGEIHRAPYEGGWRAGRWQDGTVRVFVATERLLLRQFTEADAGQLADLDSDPEVMRFLTKSRSPTLTAI